MLPLQRYYGVIMDSDKTIPDQTAYDPRVRVQVSPTEMKNKPTLRPKLGKLKDILLAGGLGVALGFNFLLGYKIYRDELAEGSTPGEIYHWKATWKAHNTGDYKKAVKEARKAHDSMSLANRFHYCGGEESIYEKYITTAERLVLSKGKPKDAKKEVLVGRKVKKKVKKSPTRVEKKEVVKTETKKAEVPLEDLLAQTSEIIQEAVFAYRLPFREEGDPFGEKYGPAIVKEFRKYTDKHGKFSGRLVVVYALDREGQIRRVLIDGKSDASTLEFGKYLAGKAVGKMVGHGKEGIWRVGYTFNAN